MILVEEFNKSFFKLLRIEYVVELFDKRICGLPARMLVGQEIN